jgi:hypothetical protein
MANALLVGGGLGVAGYVGWKYWQREQVKAATLAEAARLQAGGMSVRDAITNAAAGACTAAAGVYKMPPTVAGPLCKGVAVLAIKGAELAAKGAVIAGKVVGKGVAAGGKAVGKGAKFVAYDAPKKVIGTTVNAAVNATIGHILPKKATKIVKKVFCLGIFCGLDGVDVYDRALGADAGRARARRAARPSNPFAAHARALGGLGDVAARGPNPFAARARGPRGLVGGAVARGVLRAGRSSPRRAVGPGRLLRAL